MNDRRSRRWIEPLLPLTQNCRTIKKGRAVEASPSARVEDSVFRPTIRCTGRLGSRPSTGELASVVRQTTL